MLVLAIENILPKSRFVKKIPLLASILILLFAISLLANAEIGGKKSKTGQILAEIHAKNADLEKSSKENWHVINDAPFQITHAPPVLKSTGETLEQLGFNDIGGLLNNIEKKLVYLSVAFSSDGRFIAFGVGDIFGGKDNTVKLWDIQNQKLVHTFEGHASYVNSVAFSRDGRFIASGSGDSTVKLWDIQNKKFAHSFEGHSSNVNSVAFSPDGRFIASGSDDNTIKLWDIQNKKLAHTFVGHSNNVNSVTLSLDGRFIASGAGQPSRKSDNTIKLWDIQNKKLVFTFEGHSSAVNSVAFSTDGRFITSGAGDLSGSSDNTVKLWDIQNQKLVQTFEGHLIAVFSVAFSSDGRFITSGSLDYTIKLWDIQNRKLAHTFEGHTSAVYSVAFSPDGRFIASCSLDRTVKFWDIQNQKLAYSFEGHSIAVNSVALSLDGNFIASSGSYDTRVKLWDIQNQVLSHTFEGHSSEVNSVAFSPNGHFVASGSLDNTIKLWDIQNQKFARTFEGHSNNVNSVAFSSDGRFMVSGSSDNTVKLWDIQNQKLVHTFEGHSGNVSSVAINPNGRFIASGSLDNTIKLWDIQNHNLSHTFEGHSSNVSSVAINPNGRFIVSGSLDKTIKLWDIQNQILSHTFKGHSSEVNSVAFSPDGSFIATGSRDNTVKLWDIQNQKLAYNFEGHSGTVRSVSFSSDGRFIASGSNDNSVKLWNIQKLSNEMTLLSSRVDSWLLIKNNDLVFRGEHGNLLRKKSDNNDWLSVFPADMKLKSDFSISINPTEFSISAGQGKEAELSVDIHNIGSEAAFWLKLKPTLSEDSVVRLDAPENQLKTKGQSFFKPSYITRLEPGESKAIHARISTNLEFPAKFIQSGVRKLSVTVVSANGTEVSQTLDVDVKLPRLKWLQATLEPDGSSLKVLLKNTGTDVFNEANVQLVAEGLSQIQQQLIPELEPEQSIELAFILPEQANLVYLFELLFNPDSLQLQGLSNQLPVYSWTMTAPQISWLLPWLIALLLVLILIAIFYIRRYRHPLVVELSNNPAKMRMYIPEQVAEAVTRLEHTQLLGTVIRKNDLTESTVKKGIDFFESHISTEKIHYLEQRLGTKAKNIQGDLWELPLPKKFPLNLNRCLVYFPPPKYTVEDVFNHLKSTWETARTTTLLIGPTTEYQRQLYRKSNDVSNKFVAPSGVEITQLMLSPEPEIALAKILARQLALTQLSPYQLGGGVNSESVFFGRQEIIDHILNREPSNYLLAGGRQLGKSSLLKALERRFHEQGDITCFYIALSSEVLIPRLISLLKLPKGADIDAFAEYAEKSDKRLVFLIDEADKFICHERENDYQILNTLRQVSEEGKCHFILAGFWELFQHAVLDYQSPLKNFAETIQVGALEVDACLKLATEPMQTMRLEYANPSLVEKLLKTTGGRANLIAIVCHQIIEKLASDQRIIEEDDLIKALYSEKTLNALRGWGAMTGDHQACRLDRIIVYTTIKQDAFTLEQLLEILKQHQIKLNMEMIEQSLARLELGFVLGLKQKRQYVYQVPLFQEMILTESPTTKLTIELNDWNVAKDN